jgi:hypothetical protein
VLILAARLFRKWFGPVTTGRVARGVRWLWSDRRRRLRTAAVLACGAIFFGAYVWYAIAASRAQAALVAAYEEINARSNEGLTEADVIAIVGGPPDDGPSPGVKGPFKGGGQTGIPTTPRMWTRYGTQMEVHFGEDGTVKSEYISDPPGLGEKVARGLGL